MNEIHAELPLKAAAAYEQVAKRIANYPYSVSAENLLVPLPARPSEISEIGNL